MIITVSVLNLILFIYLVWVFVAPKSALFFVKDKAKRKRVPYAIFILIGYIVLMGAASSLVDDTQDNTSKSEDVVNIESLEEPTEDYSEYSSDPTELTPEIIAAYDSIHKAGIELYRIEGKEYTSGPNKENWRTAQWILATANASTLKLIETEMLLESTPNSNKTGGLRRLDPDKKKEFESKINDAMATSLNPHFGGYYKIGAIRILLEANHKKGVQLKEHLSKL